MRIRIKIDETRARTPPSLLGIDRRIAYANKKYHSGLILLLNINEDLFWYLVFFQGWLLGW